ncbi:hypothetical protein LT493_19165 [Streptomyces tricolor]|nr:hypothetical protein [Streptomyces tricolor]
MVAERIRVVSRSARTPEAPPVEWTARDDGSYTVRTLPAAERPEPGTTVYLTARAGAAEWLAPERVRALARDFGSLLPYDVRVGGEPVTELPAPWDRAHPGPAGRRAALARHCHELFGFTPLDSIDLDVPVAGVRGVAYVPPSAVSPAQRATHRVHLEGMLLTERAEQLLPDWAFFVRCVLDTDSLRPTASRESLYEDETLAAVRDALGTRIRSWLTGLAAGDPERLGAFLAVHHLGVKSLARHDTEMLRTMLPWLPFETTDGQLSLEEFAQRHLVVHFTRTVEESTGRSRRSPRRRASAWSTAATPTTASWSRRCRGCGRGRWSPSWDADTVTAHLDAVDPGEELALAGFLAAARAKLDPLGCDVVVRAFHPLSVPALHLDDRSARHEQAPRGGRGTGRRPVGGHPGLAARQRPARASGAQPPQSAGAAHRFARRPGADRHRDRVAVRAGPADGPAPAAAGRLRAAQPGVHRAARMGDPRGEGRAMSGITDFDALRRALADNSEEPEGPARNARAEEPTARRGREAEHPARRDRGARAPAEGLQLQLRRRTRCSSRSRGCCACGTSGRRTFDEDEAHSLHWVFRRMSAGHAGPAARPARLDREVARRDGAPLPARRALGAGRAQRRVQRGRAHRGPRARGAGVRRVAGRRPGPDGRLPRLRAARAGRLAGPVRPGRGGAAAVAAGAGGRVRLCARAAHGARLLAGPAAAPRPPGGGPGPPSARVPAGAAYGEHGARTPTTWSSAR